MAIFVNLQLTAHDDAGVATLVDDRTEEMTYRELVKLMRQNALRTTSWADTHLVTVDRDDFGPLTTTCIALAPGNDAAACKAWAKALQTVHNWTVSR